MNQVKQRMHLHTMLSTYSDYIGAAASSLCMIHCLLTPMLFAVQLTSLSCSEISPVWWKTIDYIFLVITFFAVWYTSKATQSKWVRASLFISWIILALLVLNASFHVIPLPHILIYIPAITMIATHMYNRRYCVCQNNQGYHS